MHVNSAGIALAGLAVGFVYGLFGIGSAVATPVLSLLGVPGLVAVIAPLPALAPSSLAGAWSYLRGDNVDRPLARRILGGALPAAVAGAVASRHVDGRALLLLSGVVLLGVGVRVLRPGAPVDPERAARRRADTRLVVAAGTAIGFLSGLLANGGGFLLVPLLLVVLGYEITTATGTSLLIAAGLSLPTLATHLVLGDVDWLIAGAFAAGLVPAALVGGQVAQRLPTARLRRAFGVFTVAFAAWYLTRQLGTLA